MCYFCNEVRRQFLFRFAHGLDTCDACSHRLRPNIYEAAICDNKRAMTLETVLLWSVEFRAESLATQRGWICLRYIIKYYYLVYCLLQISQLVDILPHPPPHHPDRLYWIDRTALVRMLQWLSGEIHGTCPTNITQIKLEKIIEEVKKVKECINRSSVRTKYSDEKHWKAHYILVTWNSLRSDEKH